MPIKTRSALLRKTTKSTDDVDKQNNIKKRKLEEEEEIEKPCNEEEEEEEEDRFSRLPESLRLHILSCLDAQEAVQTSVLSKSFKSSWASVPVLNFHLNNCCERWQLRDFDKFVQKFLSKRDTSVSLEKINFIVRGKKRSAKMLKSVFDHALSLGVNEFEAKINATTKESHIIVWPDFLKNDSTNTNISTDSLTSLILKGRKLGYLDCLFLRQCRPKSAGELLTFQNLRVLYIKRGNIIEFAEPNFSGFPVLEKLTLIDCWIRSTTLDIKAFNLSELSILRDPWCGNTPHHLNLKTPKLKFFKFRSPVFPFSFETRTELPFLETVVLDDPTIATYSMHNVERIEDLLQAVRSVYSPFAVFDSVVMQLSLFNKDSSLYEKLKLDLKNNLMKDCESFLDNTIEWLSESLERRPPKHQFSCSVIMRI